MQRHRDIEILTHIETPVGIISNRKWTGIQALMKKYRMELKPSGIEKVNLSTSRNIDLQEIGTEQIRSGQRVRSPAFKLE